MLQVNHWEEYRKIWDLVERPIKPCILSEDAYDGILKQYAGKRILVLGYTDCIVNHPAHKLCVDSVFFRDTEKTSFIQATWQSMSFSDESFDLIIGDGSLNLVHEDGIIDIIKKLHRFLAKDGQLFFRTFFLPPKLNKTYNLSGKNYNFSTFKFGFMCSNAFLYEISSMKALRLGDVYEKFYKFYDKEALITDNNWKEEVFKTIDVYKDSDKHIRFYRQDDLKAIMSLWFKADITLVNNYDLFRTSIVRARKI